MTSAHINWADIREKLPYERTDAQRAKRKELFNRFDPNGNGILSLAEVLHVEAYLLRYLPYILGAYMYIIQICHFTTDLINHFTHGKPLYALG